MFSNLLFGTSNALELPPPSEIDNIRPKSAGDVLSCMAEDPNYRNTCSALNKFAAMVGRPSEIRELSLDLIVERKCTFRAYLEQHNYSDVTICHYVQWIYLFLEHAKSFGWVPDGNLSTEWKTILTHPKTSRSMEIVRHFAARTTSPSEVTRAMVNQWIDERVIAGERSFEAAYKIANSFIRCLLELGHTQVDPVLAVRLDSYGIALKNFPSPLKEQVEKLLAYRQADPAEADDLDDLIDGLEDLDLGDFREMGESDESRPRHSQIRAVTAKLLEESICRLYGYLRNIRKVEVTDLKTLFNPRVLESFRKWLKKERGVTGGGLRAVFVPIITAMRQSKEFDPKLLNWIGGFRDKLGKKLSKDEIRLKKALRQLEYSEVAAIPRKIYLERARLARKTVDIHTQRGKQVYENIRLRLANLAKQELAIRWYLLLPWRQRNMREMRIDGTNPNLFKGQIPEGFEIDKPLWVLEELKKNPKAEVWLYRFTAEENKTEKLIFCVLPKPLIQPLEDYLQNWRPILLAGKNTPMLFVNNHGEAMSKKTFAFMVYEVTLRFGGKRMNPHIFRDVFAFAYLKKRPRDFISLSIMLWHSSINTTMENYGGKFNASCGTAAVEDFYKEVDLR